ncbi:MAG: 50S ribosomal protein L6 [Clostridiales bacterium GWF2_38_85]|nr:MAG: 50S ribosomal protein L6 [Clostridiales bacterium GWF2_38_85]HBL84932.1 50S ribosomal protein L6 [Clostridiales bacterium]
MSRIGRAPIQIPTGITVTIGENNHLTVKGPNGSLSQQLHSNMLLKLENNVLTVSRPNDEKVNKSLHGLTRSLAANMVKGVTEGFKKELEINGVGYKAQKQSKQLILNLGYSHNIIFDEPTGITIDVPAPNKIIVSGADKQKVGQLSAEIRGKRPPEPYLGKGIKYVDEHIRRKSGKTGK